MPVTKEETAEAVAMAVEGDCMDGGPGCHLKLNTG